MALQFTPITTLIAKRMSEKNPILYPDGMVRISPSDAVFPPVYQKDAQRIRDFEVRDDDVWVTGYPKSGTTWTQEMVWLLVNNLDYEGARVIMEQRFPSLEYTSLVKIDVPDQIHVAEQLSSPRCIRCHLPVDLLPTQLWTKKPKIIHVMREPKDVAVSYHYHHLLYNGTCTMNEFLEAFLEGFVRRGSYWKFLLDFWKLKDEPHILFNTFEEMKLDLPGVIRQTSQFLGKILNAQQVDQLAQHLSFISMKENPAVNREGLLKKFGNGQVPHRSFIRKGKVGDGQESMSEEMLKRFDRWTAEQTMGSGFPYYGAN